MDSIHTDDILIPEERFRKVFDEGKIQALADNIAEFGLLHLPILYNDNTLVSGERRVRAMRVLIASGTRFTYLGQYVEPGQIPFALYSELNEDNALEIELHENVVRENLSWQEESRAVEALHEHYSAKNPDWNPIDTMREMGKPDGNVTTTVTDKLTLAKNLHRPEVRRAKSEGEAKKVLRKTLEREFTHELGKNQKPKENPHDLTIADSLERLPLGAPEVYDVLISDPPYGINAQSFGANIRSNTTKHTYTDDEKTALACYQVLATEGYRICKPEAHAYIFCDFSFFLVVAGLFNDSGWEVWPRPIIWYKHTGSIPKPDLGPKYTHEYILFANKGNRGTTGLFPDVIDCLSGINKRHAAEKPVEVYVDLLRRSATPGDLIIDPFAGSGPVFPAANALGLKATGIEMDEDMAAMARGRMGDKP